MLSKECFTEQIRKLRDTYGDKNYPKERCSLFFREVEKYPDELVTRAIDKLIYEEKHPPMPPKIIETISTILTKQREHEINTTRDKNEFEEAIKSSNNPEFAKLCNSVISELMVKKMNKKRFIEADEYIDTYCKQLELEERRPFCNDCRNKGYAYKLEENYSMMYRCHCSHGKRTKEILKYKNQDGQITELKHLSVQPNELEETRNQIKKMLGGIG